MRKRVAVAGIGGVIAIGSFVGAGPASASVEGFLREMDTPFATPDEQLAAGTSFCTSLTGGRAQNLSGAAGAGIITEFSDNNASQGRAGVYATKLMVAAVRQLCPENKDFFMTAARAYDAQAGE